MIQASKQILLLSAGEQVNSSSYFCIQDSDAVLSEKPKWGVSFDLADFVHDGHYPSVAKNNELSSIKSGTTTSPEILSTTELVSAVGQIWNLLNPDAVSEAKDQKNVILNDLGGAGFGREAILDDYTKYFCVDKRTGSHVTQMVQPKFEFLKVTQKMLMFEPCSRNYSRLLFWRFLNRGTSSRNESWEGKGLATAGIANELDKIYGWMKELIPAGSKDLVNFSEIEDKKTSKSSTSGSTISSIEGCISRNPTNPANNLASRTADCYSDSVKSEEAALCDNARAVTIQKSSSLCSDYFLGALQDINVNGSASRAPNSILCTDYHINCLAHYKSTYEHFKNTGDCNVPENAREEKSHNIDTEDTNGIQIQSSARESPQHAFAKQEHAFAGAFAGIFVSLCLHPIDTVKTVIQSCPAEQKSISYIGRSIVSERGVTGLYRGIGSNIASSAPISAIYAFTYESAKGYLLPLFPKEKEYHSFAHCIAGGCASIATSFVFTPSERIKQQMQIGSHYNNCWNALVGIIGKGGFHSLYTGWGAVLCRNIPQSVIKLVCGGLAGSTAALFTTPFDVVKTRLQTQIPGSMSPYGSIFHALQEIGKNEGLKGLYRGLTPRLVMYMSQGALFFASYEFLKRIFSLEVPLFNAPSIQYIEKIEDDSASLPVAS
ncbi:unnamed protein product [Dovyalis caffra]|uniref:Mitochondrial carrier protein n=1 Tax=Dovyalis caffra TaxID=77055 RepID=A0AAV1RJZ6_9ROSI|nr:unnamed protein product [Dovyalis caffra]